MAIQITTNKMVQSQYIYPPIWWVLVGRSRTLEGIRQLLDAVGRLACACLGVLAAGGGQRLRLDARSSAAEAASSALAAVNAVALSARAVAVDPMAARASRPGSVLLVEISVRSAEGFESSGHSSAWAS